jgi:hypothetical protein
MLVEAGVALSMQLAELVVMVVAAQVLEIAQLQPEE